MATGGNPLARAFVMLVLIAVPAAVFTLDQTAVAQESEATGLLKKGLAELRAGKYEQGVATLRQALAADPSNEEVMAALGRAQYESLLALIASGQEGANVVKALLDKAMPILPAKAFNEAELGKLVRTAVTAEEYIDRFDAAMTLSRVYGEFAVPGLVAYLASSNSDHRINAHITLSRRIGRDAVLPLNEALYSGDANVRRMVAIELGMIGDERSIPALAELAGSEQDANVRQEAEKALQNLSSKFPFAGGMSAADLYLRLSGLYYEGDYRILALTDRPLVTWHWGKDGLAGQPVPRHLYVLKLSEEAAYDALRLDSGNAAAAALLARVIASQKMASDMVGAISDDDLTVQFAAGLVDAGGTVAAMGWDLLALALADSLDQGDDAAAAFILAVMPWVYGSTEFTTDNPVVRSTTDASAGVRLAATEAVLRFNGTRRVTAFPDPDGFVGLVAKAVGEVIPRQILVVDGDDARRNKMLTELNAANYLVFGARTGTDGVVRAMRYPGIDLIVLSVNLVDMEPIAVMGKLAAMEHAKNIPIVVVGTSEQAADDNWRALYQDKDRGQLRRREPRGRRALRQERAHPGRPRVHGHRQRLLQLVRPDADAVGPAGRRTADRSAGAPERDPRDGQHRRCRGGRGPGGLLRRQ
ncbi:MAG: HEAT repeat domain-containing protein [Planctomycetota bacterium]|jgi:CheY-like chemotaxis protein